METSFSCPQEATEEAAVCCKLHCIGPWVLTQTLAIVWLSVNHLMVWLPLQHGLFLYGSKEMLSLAA